MRTDHEARLVPLETLKPYGRNPRRGDVGAIRESLRANGQYRPLVVRRKTREVLAGNHTLLAASEEGWSEVWATFVDVDAKQAKRIVLVDNRTNDLIEQAVDRLSGGPSWQPGDDEARASRLGSTLQGKGLPRSNHAS